MKTYTFRLRVALAIMLIGFAASVAWSVQVERANAQTTTPPILDLSGIPISQIGTPIALFIKCTLLQQAGPPIPEFESECGAVVAPPPGGGSQTGGGPLTGVVIAPPGPPPTDTTTTGTLTGDVVTTQVAGENADNGGGGSRRSGGGGGGGGGSSGNDDDGNPGEVLGTTNTTPPDRDVGGFVPDVPDTGAEDVSVATLIIAALVSLGGLLYLTYTAGFFRKKF